jgi:hypothetical protein
MIWAYSIARRQASTIQPYQNGQRYIAPSYNSRSPDVERQTILALIALVSGRDTAGSEFICLQRTKRLLQWTGLTKTSIAYGRKNFSTPLLLSKIPMTVPLAMRTDVHAAMAQKLSIQRSGTLIDGERSIAIVVFFKSQWSDVARQRKPASSW